jgi:competence protein ComEC
MRRLVLYYISATVAQSDSAVNWQGQEGNLKSIITRFRAYQLGSSGSSFSFFADGHFTVLEGRLTELSKPHLMREMANCGVETADTLHITSWDSDHCSASELADLLMLTIPERIEYPGYEPHSDRAEECLAIIESYSRRQRSSNRPARLQAITPEYICGLTQSEALAFRDVLCHPHWIDDSCLNNNSTVKFFRHGSFNILSLGDVESADISARLRRDKYLSRETDVMILAHHGADNGFTNKSFLERIEPSLAICSSDFDNQHDHPRDEIRELLYEQGIRLMTTKTGDIIVKSIGDHTGAFRAINLKANSTDISSQCDFEAKKRLLLSYNSDTIRQLYTPRPSYRSL